MVQYNNASFIIHERLADRWVDSHAFQIVTLCAIRGRVNNVLNTCCRLCTKISVISLFTALLAVETTLSISLASCHDFPSFFWANKKGQVP